MEEFFSGLEGLPVLLVGDLILDEYLFGTVDRISPEAPVPVLHVVRKDLNLGGAGNVARNLVSLGAKVTAVGLLGTDAPGELLKAKLEDLHVDTRNVLVDPMRQTPHKTRLVSGNHQLIRFDEESVAPLSPENEARLDRLIPDLLSGQKGVLISDYGKGAVTRSFVRRLLDEARSSGIPSVVDPKGKDYDKYSGAFLITPNVREAAEAAGIDIKDEDSLCRAAHILQERFGLQNVVITRGKDGMTAFSGDEVQHFPVLPQPLDVIDVTGAGDTAAAIITLAVSQGLPLATACQVANAGGAIVVSRFGCSAPTREELYQMLQGKVWQTKVTKLAHLREILSSYASDHKTVVFTNGCFDVFHPGHLHILTQAKKLGDILVVGVNSDKSVRRLKGPTRPVFPQEARANFLASISCVDYVIIFDEDTPIELIRNIKPSILVKGKDWAGKEIVGQKEVEAAGGEVVLVPLLPGWSTSQIVQRVYEQQHAQNKS